MSSPPPAYELPDSNEAAGPNSAPPGYFDLYPVATDDKTVCISPAHARYHPRSNPVQKCINLLCRPVSIVVLFVMCFIIPSSMVTMGGVFFHQCSIRPFVPVFLIVFGGLVLSMTTVHVVKAIIFHKTGRFNSDDNSHRTNARRNSCEAVSVVFLVFWFVIGSYYIARTYREWSESGRGSCSGDGYHDDDCCSPVLMYYSIAVITTIFGMSGLAIVMGCSCYTLLKCVSLLSPTNHSNTASSNDL